MVGDFSVQLLLEQNRLMRIIWVVLEAACIVQLVCFSSMRYCTEKSRIIRVDAYGTKRIVLFYKSQFLPNDVVIPLIQCPVCQPRLHALLCRHRDSLRSTTLQRRS